MAVANNWQQAQAAGGATLTLSSYAVGAGNNKILVVVTGAKGSGESVASHPIPSTVKWGTLDLTIIKQANCAVEGGFTSGATIWGLLAPAAETHDIVVTWPTSQGLACQMGACYLIGREQVLPTTLTNTMNSVADSSTTKWTLAINSVPAGAYVVDACSSSQAGGTHSATETATGQVQKVNNLTDNSFFLASEREVAADANVTFGWVASSSSGRRGMVMAAFRAAPGAGVAPNFVATGAASSTTGSSIAPAYPTSANGLLAGDLFILHCVGQGQTTNLPTVSAPSGWSTLYSSEGANNQCKQWIFVRDARATGAETGTLTVDCTTPGTNGVVAGAIYAFHNVTPSATFTEDPDVSTGTGISIAPPAVTAGNARLCCAFVGVGGNQTPPSFTTETGGDWTARATSAGATGDGYCLQLQTATVSNATITGGAAAITSDDWVVRAFALISFDAVTASSLVDAAPTVGQPALGQIHALAATSLSDRAPLVGQPTIARNFLTATGLAGQAPLLGQPGIDQLASLAAADLGGAAPALDQVTIGQTHALAAAGLTDQAVLAQPSLGQAHALTAASLTGAAPALPHPAVGQEHALAATSLATTPVSGAPVMVVRRNLAAASLVGAAPALDQPPLAQHHALAAASLASRAPVLDRPILASAGQFTPLPLISGEPDLGEPTAGQEHALAAQALGGAAPTLASPVVGQEHALAAAALAGAAPALAELTAGQRHALAADALAEAAPTLDQSTVAQTHRLVATGLAGAAAILNHASLTIGIFGLAANDLSARPVMLDQPATGQEHALAAFDQDAASLLGAPVLESFLPGVFVADDLDAAPVIIGSPKLNWREIGVIRFIAANTQAKVDTFGARPAYASAGAGISSAAQFGALAPLAPVDVQPGDLLLWVAAEFDSDHDSANVALPTGYVALVGSPFGTNAMPYAPRVHVALKSATGIEASQPQSFNYSLSSGDALNRSISARVYRITATDGFAASFIEGVAVAEGITSGAATIICPPVAPAGVNRLGLIATVVASATGDTASADGIWQQAVPEYQSTTGGDVTLDLQWAALAREPSTGAQIPYGATGAAWVSVGFALAPPRTVIDFASAGVLIEDLPPVLAIAVNM